MGVGGGGLEGASNICNYIEKCILLVCTKRFLFLFFLFLCVCVCVCVCLCVCVCVCVVVVFVLF